MTVVSVVRSEHFVDVVTYMPLTVEQGVGTSLMSSQLTKFTKFCFTHFSPSRNLQTFYCVYLVLFKANQVLYHSVQSMYSECTMPLCPVPKLLFFLEILL